MVPRVCLENPCFPAFNDSPATVTRLWQNTSVLFRQPLRFSQEYVLWKSHWWAQRATRPVLTHRHFTSWYLKCSLPTVIFAGSFGEIWNLKKLKHSLVIRIMILALPESTQVVCMKPYLLKRFIMPLASVCLRLFNTNSAGLRFHLDQRDKSFSYEET